MSSVWRGAKTHYIANQKRGYIKKYVNIIYELGSGHVTEFAVVLVLIDKLSGIERQS